MSEETGTEKKTVRGRASIWAHDVFNSVKCASAYREGYRVFNSLLALKRGFGEDSEFDLWFEEKHISEIVEKYGQQIGDVAKGTLRLSFITGALDAELRAPKTQVDSTPDMFEKSTQTPTAARRWGPEPTGDNTIIEEEPPTE